MIKLQVIGNLGGDCIQREVNGKTVINFNVAHSEKFKDSTGNLKEKTTWVKCAYWTERPAVAQYLKKGKTVFAEGAPEAEAFTNKEGQQVAILKMSVFSLQLVGGVSESGQPDAHSSTPSTSSNSSSNVSSPVSSQVEEPADDLPF